ncbi:MAG: ComF family protein [Pseudomonadota bacterium]|nr:ComF family protein [Pseudomonadota bacterium]
MGTTDDVGKSIGPGPGAVNRPALRRWLAGLHWRLFPPTCLLCGARGQARRDLCAGCAADLLRNLTACPCCGQPQSTSLTLCGECQRQPPAFVRTVAPFLYQPPLDLLIRRLKFHAQLPAARLLGGLLADVLAARTDDLPQCLIPVPLHPARLRERGFNQSLELARPVARRLDIPIAAAMLRRTRLTTPQTGLALPKRQTNVRGAFAAGPVGDVRRAAILDDVVTTGATVRELARVLRAAGVEEIEVWAVARTAGK